LDRRHFLRLAVGTPAVLRMNGKKPEQSPSETSEPKPCGICGGPAAFDNWLDINFCPACGARETGKGWEKR